MFTASEAWSIPTACSAMRKGLRRVHLQDACDAADSAKHKGWIRVDQLLDKPVRPETLRATAKRLLGKNPGAWTWSATLRSDSDRWGRRLRMGRQPAAPFAFLGIPSGSYSKVVCKLRGFVCAAHPEQGGQR